MFRRLLACVLLFTTSAVYAQRVLTSPDLSTFSTGGLPTFSVDANTGWKYVSGFRSRAMGLARTGVVRVTGEGVIDAGWQTTGMGDVFSHIALKNGDLYVHGLETASGPKVITRYTPGKSSLPVSVYRGDGITNNPNSGVGAIFGGRGRWVYFTTNEVVNVTLRRIDTTTGLVDASWTYSTSQQLLTVAQGTDDALFVLEQQYPGINRDLYVRRIATGTSADVLWTRTYTPGEASIAADEQGRVYVMKRGGNPSKDTTIQRLDSAGNVDPLWAGAAASQAVSQSRWNRAITSTGDSLLVPAYVDPTSTEPGRAMLLRFDPTGLEIARWAPGFDGRIDSVADGMDGRVYVKINNALQVLDTSTLQPIRTLALTFGSLGDVDSAIALPDGGRLLFGRFDVLYAGQRYQNVLRVRTDGTPDTSWRVVIDGYYVSSATVTPQGVILSGNFTQVNGTPRAGVALVSLDAGAALLNWAAATTLGNSAFAFDGQDKIYFTTLTGTTVTIRRLSSTSSQIDAGWSITVDALASLASSLGLDKAGGVWIFRDAEPVFNEPTVPSYVQRFNIADGKSTLTISTTVSRVYWAARQFLSTSEHVYLGNKRYAIATGGQLDANWSPVGISNTTSQQTIAGGYLYYTGYNYGAGGAFMRRAALTGNGAEDATWRAQPSEMVNCTHAEIPLFVAPISTAPEAAEFVIRCRDDLGSAAFARDDGRMALGTTDNKTITSTAVIEYFNRDVGRYFITGRAAEQATLDALPASFQRTGMRFSAKSGEYRDVPEQPVCRFYAAPENGGSNTHFYGTGDDCPALNTVRQVRFEGFDFAAIKPTNAACPTTAPNPVYRLFNNKSATNQGNHRYAVTVATKAKMIAKGWIDEGAVFCSASVTDASN